MPLDVLIEETHAVASRRAASPGFVVVIPALQPGHELLAMIREFAGSETQAIVIVDDGSGPAYSALFQAAGSEPGVHILRHAVNLGKGAALKTGMNFALCSFPGIAGIVTADADGQHSVRDILKVGSTLVQQKEALVLGRRTFGSDVPLRSRFGNSLTCVAVQFLVGKRISDTQTGLRGIPAAFAAPLLHLASSGYEFELDMLTTAKHYNHPIVETPIETIYLEGNKSSHFNPLRDSLRIYFALLRFTGVSLITAVIDNVGFLLAFHYTGSIFGSQIIGRVAAVAFNYTAARKAVFFSRRNHSETLPAYLALVGALGLASYTLIRLFSSQFGWNVFAAKIVAESLLFLLNFVIQRDRVFTQKARTPQV